MRGAKNIQETIPPPPLCLCVLPAPELPLLRAEPTVLHIAMSSPQTDPQAVLSPDCLTLEGGGHAFPAIPYHSLQMALLDRDQAEPSVLGV